MHRSTQKGVITQNYSLSFIFISFTRTVSSSHSHLNSENMWTSPCDSNGDVSESSTSELSSCAASCGCRPLTFLTSSTASCNICHHITQLHNQRQFTQISQCGLCSKQHKLHLFTLVHQQHTNCQTTVLHVTQMQTNALLALSDIRLCQNKQL